MRFFCAVHGSVEGRKWHDKSAIGVPLGGIKGRRWAIVVSDDLLRALFVETSVAIQFYWAVSETTVALWRRALGIESRGTASFLDAMSKVGSVTGRAPGMAERLCSMNANPWTPNELRIMPMLSTAEVVARTGRSREAVEHARSRYGLVQQRELLTCRVCGHAWLPQNGACSRALSEAQLQAATLKILFLSYLSSSAIRCASPYSAATFHLCSRFCPP